ncbi:MAG: hypothetical protein NZM31_15435 [Gemmatales bacterium]|nr:hypothetical protein [Gemmatales bacterium]MDW8388389.1 hypothetical protein [Gemmatales bacterium]
MPRLRFGFQVVENVCREDRRAEGVERDASRAEGVSPPCFRVTGQLTLPARPENTLPARCGDTLTSRLVKRSPARFAITLLFTALMCLGCGSLRDYLPEWGKLPEDDPLRGRPRSLAASTQPGPVNDRIPAWTDASRPRQPDTTASTDSSDIPSPPPVLPPSPARLAAVPSLKGGNPLAIETPARSGRQPPIQQTGGTDLKTAREQALEQLRARGVNWHQSEPVGGQWRLRCTVPDPSRSDVSRFYEAYGTDELAAIWAVIQQIDEQRQRPSR